MSGRTKRRARAYLDELEEIAALPMPRFFRYYVLDGREARPARNMLEAIGVMPRPHVGLDTIAGVRVSTVFLGIDHSHGRPGGPVLFETMIFGGGVAFEGWQLRYRTYAEAEAGHAAIVARVRAATAKDERPAG